MEELRVFEVVILARCGRNTWQGEAYFMASDDERVWAANAALLFQEAMRDMVTMNDTGRSVAWRVRGQSHTLKGPLAKAMRQHLNMVGGEVRPLINWSLCDRETWATTEGYPRG